MKSQTHGRGPRARATVLATLLSVSGGLLFGAGASLAETAPSIAKAAPLPVASVHFEQNATDGDVEVVFKAKGGDDGLASLKVVSPDGRTVIDFTAPDSSTLGMRQFGLESPEPRDVSALKAAYPEGEYAFTARTFSGATLVGRSTLSHRLPATAEFVSPAPRAKDVPIADVKVSWRGGAAIASYIVEIEQDDLGTTIQAVLPGSTTTFAVPDGFLRPGTEYQLAIGTVGNEGNTSFVETTFTTGE